MINARDYVDNWAALVNMDNHPVEVQMDDGVYKTTTRRLLYSAIWWKPLAKFVKIPLTGDLLLKKEDNPDDDVFVGAKTHQKFYGIMFERWCDIYGNNEYDFDDDREVFYKEFELSRNEMYNLSVTHGTKYMTSFNARHMLQISRHPEIKKLRDAIGTDPAALNRAYDGAKEIMLTDPDLKTNPLCIAVRTGALSQDQINQLLVARGKVTEIDSTIFRDLVPSSYFEGMQTLGQHLKEARMGCKSLLYQAAPLQKSEYSNRTKQIVGQVIRKIEYQDCKTDQTMPWTVRADNTNAFIGMYYYDDKGVEHRITKDTVGALVGKSINLRTIYGCKPKDRQNVCAKCFGDLQYNYPHGSNVGQYITTAIGGIITQLLLKVKHVDNITSVDFVTLTSGKARLLERAANDSSSLCINKHIAKEVTAIEFTLNRKLDLLRLAGTLNSCNPTTETILKQMTIISTDENGEMSRSKINPTFDSKPASLSLDMLKYLFSTKDAIMSIKRKDSTWIVTVNMEDYQADRPVITVPHIHSDMNRYHSSVDEYLSAAPTSNKKGERSVEINSLSDAVHDKQEGIEGLYDLIASKVDVPLSLVLGISNAFSATDPDRGDYYPARYGDDYKFVSIRAAIRNRSMSGIMAFQEQHHIFDKMSTYTPRNRPSSPQDQTIYSETTC